MKCVIIGVEPREYDKQNGQHVKGFNLYMLADNANVYGKEYKDCFISVTTPVYVNNKVIFDDFDKLVGREVNAEWDVKSYGQKSIKVLINFEFLADYYDLVKRV